MDALELLSVCKGGAGLRSSEKGEGEIVVLSHHETIFAIFIICYPGGGGR